MKRIIFIGFAIALLLLGFGYLKREPLFLDYLASKVPDVSLESHETFLAPHIQYIPPEGVAPPYPVLAQFHGCSGMRQAFMEQWADVANAAGYMAVIIDSHSPRNINREQALETVCQGKELFGQERAGDILAAFNLIKARPDVDADNIVLAGWSHGAWSVMDFLTMDMKRTTPAQFAKGVADKAPTPAGAVLFYPYCGEGARARFSKWVSDAPTLAFVAGKDSIVSPQECVDVFSALGRRGEDITLHHYPDADHVFDDTTFTQEFKHFYHEEYADDAMQQVTEFLKAQKN